MYANKSTPRQHNLSSESEGVAGVIGVLLIFRRCGGRYLRTTRTTTFSVPFPDLSQKVLEGLPLPILNWHLNERGFAAVYNATEPYFAR